MKTANKKEKVVLLDVYGIIYRAYHALPDFRSSSGEPTGALYGLASMLIKIVTDLKPDYIFACYDLAGPTFRKEAYDNYKATRKKTDDELIAQIKISNKLFEAFNIPIYSAKGFEADDIIGTIAEETKKNKGLQIIIASGDMDTMQLVDGDRVVVYTYKKGVSDMITYNEDLVLERFGFKPEFLPDYKGLRGDVSDNIIGVPGIGEKTATTLITTFGTIENLYKILKKDEVKVIKAGVTPRLVGILKENEEEAEFSKILATIRRDAPIDFKLPKAKWGEDFKFAPAEAVFNEWEFRGLIGRLKTLASKHGEVIEEKPAAPDVSPDLLKRLQIARWLLDSDHPDASVDDVLAFAKAKDARDAGEFILKRLKEDGLDKVYTEIELPLIPIIERAEQRGILIDVDYLNKLSKDYHKQIKALEEKIYKLADGEFNLNSPKQLAEVLFDKLKLEVKGLKKTAGGARSTRESELDKLKDSHPIIEPILAYRELQKLVSTYVDTLPTMVDKESRLHTTLNQMGTTTGRMSSNNPNLQNIPAREGVGRAIRNGFIATPGCELLAFDYSQIEMRVLALLSGDEELLKVFKEGRDVHTSVASRVFGVPESEVTKDMRRKAKVINFGIIYGMGVTALKQNLGSTRDEAQEFYDNYFKTFPAIDNYFTEVKAGAAKLGYTTTLFGRRRYFPAIKSKLPFMRAMAERMAMNAPIQGTATGDIVKLAMQKVDKVLAEAGLADKVHFLLQVHDELIFEVENAVTNKAIMLIKEAMEHPFDTTLPLTVNVSKGVRWGELA